MSADVTGRSRPAREAVGQLIGSSRPLSWVNTAYPFGAAYPLAGGGADVWLWVGVAYFLVPFNLLMYGVNDVFDFESDLRNPRKGGVEGVVLQDRWHRLTLWVAAVANVPFVVVLAAAGTAGSALVLAVVVFAAVAYSAPVLRFKERPLLDSVTSSTHFVGPAAFGYALAGPALTPAATAAFVAFFAWGLASHAFGAVQDITADEGAGIASVATWLGAAPTVRLALGLYLAAGVVLLVGTDGIARLSALLALLYVANVAPYVHLSRADCERANAGWRRFLWLNFLTGFLITHLFLWLARAS